MAHSKATSFPAVNLQQGRGDVKTEIRTQEQYSALSHERQRPSYMSHCASPPGMHISKNRNTESEPGLEPRNVDAACTHLNRQAECLLSAFLWIKNSTL